MNLRDADIKIWFDQDGRGLKKLTTEPKSNHIFTVSKQLWRMEIVDWRERGRWMESSLGEQVYHNITISSA